MRSLGDPRGRWLTRTIRHLRKEYVPSEQCLRRPVRSFQDRQIVLVRDSRRATVLAGEDEHLLALVPGPLEHLARKRQRARRHRHNVADLRHGIDVGGLGKPDIGDTVGKRLGFHLSAHGKPEADFDDLRHVVFYYATAAIADSFACLMSKRSRFMTLCHAATKSFTNLSFASSAA